MVGKSVRSFLLGGVIGCVCAGTLATAQSIAVDTKPSGEVALGVVTLDVTSAHLERVLRLIAQQAGVKLFFPDEGLPSTKLVTMRVREVSASDAFAQALAGTGLVASLRSGMVVLTRDRGVMASVAQGDIAGKVIDATTRQGVRGATVTLVGTGKGTMSNEDGSFRISHVAPGSYTLQVRMLGYVKTTKTLTVMEGQTVSVDVSLASSVNALDQVVVTGTIVATELKAIPSAITVITAKQIEERGITKIDQLFRGDVPGLFAVNRGSDPDALLDEVVMFSRGVMGFPSTTISPSYYTNPIKTYVDGVELADPKYLSQIDPKSIERIEILTGPQASTIYGSNAINGVMQVFTKRGSTVRPQLTLNLQSGFVENNFSSARTPQHDYSAQVNGIEGKMSYNAGGSWSYMGPWTPAKQLARTGGFGGARLDLSTTAGRVSSDLSLRRTLTQSLQRGNAQQATTAYRETGLWVTNSTTSGLAQPTTRTLSGQTLGATLSYAPTSWWSHELGFGSDVSDTEQRVTARGYASVSDTSLFLSQSHVDRRSIRYSTTARVPIGSAPGSPMQLTVTVGADSWQSMTSSMSVTTQTLTGSLTGNTSISRRAGHNAGGFLQSQLGFKDKLFVTYGLRAEWNPNYGDDAQPNLAPRFGAALTHDIETPWGPVTAKVRGSYGRSTRPPVPTRKEAVTIADYQAASWSSLSSNFLPYYGLFDYRLANSELGPEYQQGGEGGLELYFGNRGSLVVTRYNQTVDDLMLNIVVDSIRTRVPCNSLSPACSYMNLDSDGYGYYRQYQYLNIGSIRNQGWELQGNVAAGPITARGTYSWTKSRSLGITPRYRALISPTTYPERQPGASFNYLPEHTWALGVTYARSASNVSLNLTGMGRTTILRDDFTLQNLSNNLRLQQNRLTVNSIVRYINFNSPYALANLNASHRFSSRIEALLQVQNLNDTYTNDIQAEYASLGRQTKIGLRVRL